MLRGFLIAALTLVAILFVAAYVAVYTYAPPPVDPAWAVPPATEIPEGAVTVRYTGTATLVFSDGETHIMTDGWFTRPGPLAVFFGTIEPDLDAITEGLARNEVDELAAVIPLHSHYDHAMDAPEVARRTGALLLGSESTANIGRGWGLDESQIRVVTDREPIAFGEFTLTPIVIRHFEFPDPRMRERLLDDPDITEPLVPPVSAFDYKVGESYALHIAHPRGTAMVIGSAGYVQDALEGYDADVVFLGVGGLGSQTDAYRLTYWFESIDHTHPTRVVPIHWDSLTGPADGPFTGMARAAAWSSRDSSELRPFLEEKSAANPDLEFQTLPRFDPVVLF